MQDELTSSALSLSLSLWFLSSRYAASSGDVPTLKQILHTHADVDFGMGDYDRRTPMHLAATEGHEHVVALLLEQSVDPSPVDRWGGTPLDDAAKAGHDKIVEMLLRAGATPGPSSPSRTRSPSEPNTPVSRPTSSASSPSSQRREVKI